jgi:hypothetical protein
VEGARKGKVLLPEGGGSGGEYLQYFICTYIIFIDQLLSSEVCNRLGGREVPRFVVKYTIGICCHIKGGK